MNKQLTGPFLVTALVYLASIAFLPYSLAFAVKALPIVVLMALAVSQLSGHLKHFMLAALMASAAGDVFLALSFPHSFIFGLSAFLIAHVFYVVIFIKFPGTSKVTVFRKALAVGVVVFASLMAVYLLPKTNQLLVPVSVYLTVIAIMGICALLRGIHQWTVVGVVSFLCSDAILAANLFASPIPFASYLVMVSYYLAQLFIVNGMVKQQLISQQENLSSVQSQTQSPSHSSTHSPKSGIS